MPTVQGLGKAFRVERLELLLELVMCLNLANYGARVVTSDVHVRVKDRGRENELVAERIKSTCDERTRGVADIHVSKCGAKQDDRWNVTA